MKRTIVFNLVLLLLCSQTIIAQKTIYQQSSYQLKLGTAVFGIENVLQTDALDASNRMVHTASFDIILNDNENTKAVIAALQNQSKEKGLPVASIYTINSNHQATQEKQYSNITSQQVIIPALNAAEKSLLKATVKLTAANVQLVTSGIQAVGTNIGKSANAIISNFHFVMGSLPCNRVSKLSSLSINPNDKQLQNFSVEVAAADATAWNQWFLSGAGGLKKEQGYIELLAPNLKDILYTIQLADVDIVSFSSASAASGAQTIPRATVGLRVRKATIK